MSEWHPVKEPNAPPGETTADWTPEAWTGVTQSEGSPYPKYVSEFWTARQRQASALHEVSYRGCFKPQLPRFFIERHSTPGDLVYDPFSGRGTTVIESGLLDRRVAANDVNPLSRILTRPRFFLPDLDDLEARLAMIPGEFRGRADVDLSMFYHKDTEAELVALRNYLGQRVDDHQNDDLDNWIRMVATNRLTGHSPGFFSVYTLPPNQAVSPQNQIKINQKRRQKPEYREVRRLILKKTASLLRGVTPEMRDRLRNVGESGIFSSDDARTTPHLRTESVRMTVTSPPFLNVIQYARDNWLRCWFNNIDAAEIAEKITMTPTLDVWSTIMQDVLFELYRVTAAGGWVFFEVGEVRKGKLLLEEAIIPLGEKAGFICQGVLVNTQAFTKTANIWGIHNNRKGTNSNRVVLLRKSS